jgi:hypothetical protein
MAERSVEVDHSSIYRWVQKFAPKLEEAFRKMKKRLVGRIRPIKPALRLSRQCLSILKSFTTASDFIPLMAICRPLTMNCSLKLLNLVSG